MLGGKKKEGQSSEVRLAENAELMFDELFYDIDPGVYDYLIKCIGGIYREKYFYINTAK